MITDLFRPGARVLCAVSGGADSMYLLCRLHECGQPVTAAHFHHGLRGAEADRDAAFVEDFCRARGIDCIVGRGHVRDERVPGEGIEEAARRLRYAFLQQAMSDCGAEYIATAHNADDNAETVLMHLTRGSGLRGLCGIPPVRGHIIRPMLDVTHEVALAWLAEHGIPHVEDSTNAQNDYTRNRFRHEILPLLRAENPRFADAVRRGCKQLLDDADCLDGLAAEYIAAHAVGNELDARDFAGLHPAVASRVVRSMAGVPLTYEQTRSVLDIAGHGGCTEAQGVRVTASCGWLLFGGSPYRAVPETVLREGVTDLPGTGLLVNCRVLNRNGTFIHNSFTKFFVDCDKIHDTLLITGRRGGDAFRPAGRGCRKTLKALFLEKNIPQWRREAVSVLRCGGEIVGVYGFGAAQEYAAREQQTTDGQQPAGPVLCVEFIPVKNPSSGRV